MDYAEKWVFGNRGKKLKEGEYIGSYPGKLIDDTLWPGVTLLKVQMNTDLMTADLKVKKGQVESGDTEKIALWMLDTDYDGMSIEPRQVFFPMEGKNEGWDKLAKVLKAEINQDLIEKYHGVESLPFAVKENTLLAVKIVDDRGIESLKVIPLGGHDGTP